MNIIRFLLAILLSYSSLIISQTILDKPVIQIESKELGSNEIRSFAKALGLSNGKKIELQKIENKLKTLYNKGVVEELFVKAKAIENGLIINIKAKKLQKINEIEFVNVDSEIVKSIRRKYGDNYNSYILKDIVQYINDEYKKLGYYSSNVRLSLEPPKAVINVTPNQIAKISKISISCGDIDTNEYLKSILSIKEGDNFSQENLKKALSKLESSLKEEQYIMAKINNVDIKTSLGKKSVEISIWVNLGRRFQFSFVGNTVFENHELKALITTESLSQTDPVLFICEEIIKKYRAIGYHFCDVKIEKKEKENLLLVTYCIDEGAKVRIYSVKFLTSDETKSSFLEKVFFKSASEVIKNGFYFEEGLEETINNMEKNLKTSGYQNAMITKPRAIFSSDKKGVDLVLNIELGKIFRISRIEFDGAKYFKREILYETFGIKLGDIVDQEKINSGLREIAELYKREGFIDVNLKEKTEIETGETDKKVTINITIEEGKQYFVEDINISGNEKTKSEVIYREIKLKPGDKFNPQLLKESEENISLLGLFSRVEIVVSNSKENPNKKNIHVLVSEMKPGIGEIGFGGFYEEPRLRLRSFFGIGYRNLGGLNHTTSFRGQVALPFSKDEFIPFIEYSAIIGYRAPYILSLPATFVTQMRIDSYEISTSGPTIQRGARFETKIEKTISKKITASYNLIRLDRTSIEIISPQSLKIDMIGSTGPGIILDFRDDMFNPIKGSYHNIDIEIAHPTLMSDKNTAFMMGLCRNSFYLEPVSPYKLIFYLGLGYATSFLNSPLPAARLLNPLSLGGLNSIRGFSLRQFSPSLESKEAGFYNFRTEVGRDLFYDLSLTIFYDTGQIFPIGPNKGSIRHDGIGVGLRYKTPVGPVVVDLAYGLGPDNSSKTVRFYFTLGSI